MDTEVQHTLRNVAIITASDT